MPDNLPVPQSRLRYLAAASVGNTVELFDWLIYASLAPYFSSTMFPGNDPVAALLSAYLVFALGFVIRPLGALFLGRIIDRRGRRLGLIVSVTVTSLGALVIAVTPSYASIGIAAPIILVLARLAQGLTISGEQSAVATYLVEMAPPRRRYLYGAISMAAVSVGQMLSLGCVAALLAIYGAEGMQAGGWRAGFVVCAVLGLVALLIRRMAPESEVFAQQVKTRKRPQLPLLLAHKRQMLAVFLTIVPTSMGLYFVTAYLPVFFGNAGVATKEEVAGYLPLVTIYLILVIALTGLPADRFSGLKVARVGYTALAILTVPVILATTSAAIPVPVGILLYLTGLGVITAPVTIIGSRLFPPAIRGLGAGLPTAFSIAIFGGTFPLLAQALTAAGQAGLVPWYVGLGALLGLLGSVLIREADMNRASADTADPQPTTDDTKQTSPIAADQEAQQARLGN